MNDTDKFRKEFNEAQAAAKSGDYKTAFKKFEHLAEQGIAAAQYCLGVMYHNGQGAKQDSKKAATLYSDAATQGMIQAINQLGIMCSKGDGVPKDLVSSYAWFNIAAMKGDETAIKLRDEAGKKMISEEPEMAKEFSIDVIKHK